MIQEDMMLSLHQGGVQLDSVGPRVLSHVRQKYFVVKLSQAKHVQHRLPTVPQPQREVVPWGGASCVPATSTAAGFLTATGLGIWSRLLPPRFPIDPSSKDYMSSVKGHLARTEEVRLRVQPPFFLRNLDPHPDRYFLVPVS